MKRYLWILLLAFMSTTVYAAKTSQEMKMDVYGVSVTTGTQDEGLELEGPAQGAIMLSGKIDVGGKLQALHKGSYLNKDINQDINQDIHKIEECIEESIALKDGEDPIEKISSILSHYEGLLYLSLYGESEEANRQVQVIYEALLQEEGIKANTKLDLRLVYTPLNEADMDFWKLPYIKALNVNIHSLEEGKKLAYVQQMGLYEIVVSDYLAKGYGTALSEGLDAISTFYYDFVLEESSNPGVKVEHIFVCSDLEEASPKYATFYKVLEKELQPMVQVDTSKGDEVAFKITNSQLQLLVRSTQSKALEYVEYKVNETHAGQSFRAPYVQKIEPSLLHKGVNEVKVIMKFEGENEYGVTSFYIHNEINNVDEAMTYEARSSRQEISYSVGQKPTYNKPYIPVLMYHKFKDKVANTKEDQSMSVSTSLFERQLKTLLEAGYTPINFHQLQAYLEGKGGLPTKPFILTADDGYLCNYEKAYPILKKYQVQATFFVTSLYMGVENSHDHFTWEQAKEMEGSGLIDIQSHTHSHALMDGLSQVAVNYQVETSFAEIEKYLGKRDVKVLAYPQFLHTKTIKEWVKACGVQLQVTNLANTLRVSGNKTTTMDIKRIHVSNDQSPEQLLSLIKGLTQ